MPGDAEGDEVLLCCLGHFGFLGENFSSFVRMT